MRILPAVDIRGGKCVNLVQGDYARETVFSEDPAAQALAWRDQGAALVHIVDLDGAKAGRCCVRRELETIGEAGVKYEIGGGVRTMETVRLLADLGAERIILGTAAHENPGLLQEALAEYGEKIVVGIDARLGKVALRGWLDDSGTDAVEFAKAVARAGARRVIYTDILSDGMMQGPNLAGTRAVAEAVSIPVTASGGISSLEDIRALRELERRGVDEVIVGRALYLGAFTLEEAMAAAS